ncbi:MAG: peroxiredoxin [Cyclobacteriaceae bacterium]|jgi:peroxiredoxin
MSRITKYFLAIPIILFLISCGSQKEGVPVTGMIADPVKDQLVILQKYTEAGMESVDTIAIDENGNFKTYVIVKETTFFRLNFYNLKVANLILNGLEKKVEITTDMKDVNARTVITGSPDSDHLAVFDRLIDNMKEDQKLINDQGREASQNNNESEIRELSNEYMSLIDDFYGEVKIYAHKIKPSLAVFYGIGSLKLEDHFDFYDSLASFYNQELPDHFFTKNLVSTVSDTRNLAVGAVAPEISLPNPDGEIISLTSFRGKYVLIDFWAAWCRPCRQENPNVLRMYNLYKDQNFEILGVSLDRDRTAWLAAIKSDGISWQHVSDLKYFNSQAASDYKIGSIPATYLIGPDGKIIAKGLRGPSLEAKLKEIFG